jgi:hypothetical protein
VKPYGRTVPLYFAFSLSEGPPIQRQRCPCYRPGSRPRMHL